MSIIYLILLCGFAFLMLAGIVEAVSSVSRKPMWQLPAAEHRFSWPVSQATARTSEPANIAAVALSPASDKIISAATDSAQVPAGVSASKPLATETAPALQSA